MSIFSWGVQQLVSSRPEPTPFHYNPRPPGVIRNGSVTHAVLLFLDSNRGKWYSAYQVIHAVGCTQKSADWAFIFLREQGLIESCPDQRNPRYLRYGANGKTASAQVAEPRVQARKMSLVHDESPMSGAEIQGLVEVRGSRNSDCAPMGDQLRPVSDGLGSTTNARALAGQDGHGGALCSGQCRLDSAHAADESSTVLPERDPAGASPHASSGSATARAAKPQHSPAPAYPSTWRKVPCPSVTLRQKSKEQHHMNRTPRPIRPAGESLRVIACMIAPRLLPQVSAKLIES